MSPANSPFFFVRTYLVVNVIQSESKDIFKNIFNFRIQLVIEEITLYITNLNHVFKIKPQLRFAFGKEGRKNSKAKEENNRLSI